MFAPVVRGAARNGIMTSAPARDPAQRQLRLLATVLFISYLCVGMALPVVPIHVTQQLGLSNAWAGLAVGIAFLSTVASRGFAGSLSDRRGAKLAVRRGLIFYAAGALMSAAAGLASLGAWPALAILVGGRLLLGLGESLVAVGVISWGIGLVGPARSGQVLALVGAAIYGAIAVGGPIGLVLFERLGFAVVMAISAGLPVLGLLAIRRVDGVAVLAGARRPSLWRVVGSIGPHGAIVCLQGIGFAAIGAFFTLHFLQQHWQLAGLGLSAFGGGFVLMRMVFGHLPDRIGGLRLAMASLAVEAAGQLLIWGASHPATALVGALLTGLGCSMIFPAMGREVVNLVAPAMRGTALGAFAAFQDLAYGLTGPLAGLVADRAGVSKVYLVGAAAAAAGLVIAIGLHRAARTSSTAANSALR